MNRKDKREKLDKALKEITVPFLREKGFKGSLPHFRRIQSDRINLLTFQHSLYDSKFVIEIANCPLEGIRTYWRKLDPSKCTAHDMDIRYRIGTQSHKTDFWFDYGSEGLFSNVYNKVAGEVIKLWDEAEKWWGIDPYNQRFKSDDSNSK